MLFPDTAPGLNSRQLGELLAGGRNDAARQLMFRIDQLVATGLVRKPPLGIDDTAAALVMLQAAAAGLQYSRAISSACYGWNPRLYVPRPPKWDGFLPIRAATHGVMDGEEDWQIAILVSADLDRGSRVIEAGITPPGWTPDRYTMPAGAGAVTSTSVYLATVLKPIADFLSGLPNPTLQ